VRRRSAGSGSLKEKQVMKRTLVAWVCLFGVLALAGCSGGGGSGGGGSAPASTSSPVTQAPVMAVANLDPSGAQTTLLIDTAQPSGSRVVQAVTTDSSGALVAANTSVDHETIADAIVNAPPSAAGDNTTLSVTLNGQTVPVLVQALK
jgi:hypothetical protein